MTNLEYCDHKRNCNHGTRNQRVAETLSKKPIQLTFDYVFVKEWTSAAECCRNEYGKQGNVYKGYRWMYAEDYFKLFAA